MNEFENLPLDEKPEGVFDENVYTESIAEWYDRIMEAGYYDHEKEAEALGAILGDRQNVLEIGIGTGLLAKLMVERGYRVTGVDFTEAMLDRARKRLGESAKLYRQNVLSLDLPGRFDAAYSAGGVWVVTRDEAGKTYVESHISSAENNFRAIGKVTDVLDSGGLLLLGVQPVHESLEGIELKDGATYSQEVKYDLPLIRKEYRIKRGGELMAAQSSIYRRLDDDERAEFLKRGNLSEIGIDPSGSFLVLKKG